MIDLQWGKGIKYSIISQNQVGGLIPKPIKSVTDKITGRRVKELDYVKIRGRYDRIDLL